VNRTVTKRPRAKRDLIEHFAYLAEHASVEEARRFLAAVDGALQLLSKRDIRALLAEEDGTP
jgi:plasmid stabilization system protein ParE